VRLPAVKVFTVHLCVLGNLLSAGLAADEGAPHGTDDHGADGDHDGRGKHNVGTPSDVWEEHQNVDDERCQAYEKCDDSKNEERQEEPGGVCGRVKVRSDGEDEHDENEDRCHRVENENRREGLADSIGHVERIIVVGQGIP
jgi:hypothetical protein